MKTKNKILSIIIILAVSSVLAPALFRSEIVYKREAHAKQQITVIKAALDRYRKEHGVYPSEVEGLSVLMQAGPHGRYFNSDKYLNDPWNNPIKYQIEKSHSAVRITLYSFGPNGIDEHMSGDDIYFHAGEEK